MCRTLEEIDALGQHGGIVEEPSKRSDLKLFAHLKTDVDPMRGVKEVTLKESIMSVLYEIERLFVMAAALENEKMIRLPHLNQLTYANDVKIT